MDLSLWSIKKPKKWSVENLKKKTGQLNELYTYAHDTLMCHWSEVPPQNILPKHCFQFLLGWL